MSFLDKLAEDNVGLIGLSEICKISSIDDDLRSILFKTFEVKEHNGYKKSACYFERVGQSADIDMHQDADTPDVWIEKKGKLIRIKPSIIKQ